jgi:hypothetical protein
MNNEDIPANPVYSKKGERSLLSVGETKREKAFWQVYSAIISSPATNVDVLFPDIAEIALSAVNAGFKALGENNK